MLSNPPFGVDWKKIQKEVQREADTLGFAGRFGPGLPRVSDGSLLFLLHLISKKRPAKGRNEDFGYRTITVERPMRDDAGNVVPGQRGKAKGQPQPDSSRRDTENVSLSEDVQTHFEREVLPHVPDAWIDFYVFTPPRPLVVITIDGELHTMRRAELDLALETSDED